MIKLEELSFEDKVVLTIGFNKKDNSVIFIDRNDNEIRLGPDGITLKSDKGIKLISKGNIDISNVGGVNIKSNADVTVEGMKIQATANVGFTAKGNVTAELSASGQTTVKGAMVMIN